jgi:hypothetical protein
VSRTYRTRWVWPGPYGHVNHSIWGGLVLTPRVRWRGECGCQYCCTGTKRFFKRLEHKQSRRKAKEEIRRERP